MLTTPERTPSGKPSYKNKVAKGEETNNNKQANRFKKPVILQPKFEGKWDELRGHVCDCTDSHQSDQFVKNTKEVTEYVGCTYCYGGDVRLTVKYQGTILCQTK
jgi:hypothetical protein